MIPEDGLWLSLSKRRVTGMGGRLITYTSSSAVDLKYRLTLSQVNVDEKGKKERKKEKKKREKKIS